MTTSTTPNFADLVNNWIRKSEVWPDDHAGRQFDDKAIAWAIRALPRFPAGSSPCDDFYGERPQYFVAETSRAAYLVDTQGYSYARYIRRLPDGFLLCSPRYRVTAVCVDADGNIIKDVNGADADGRRVEEIDPATNSLFSKCDGPWDIEDAYEQFWNRLNPSWERNFPAGKERVKVLRVEEVVV